MAVINRTERCIVERMCKIQGIVLFLVVFGAGAALANPRSCDLVKKDLEQVIKFQPLKVLDRPGAGDICGEPSCCSQDLENDMYKYNQLLVDKYVKDSISKISTIIDTRARKFDDVFRDMMNNSKREFHEMFERTYGKIYLQNAEVFSDFFSELETYYKKGTVRLSDTMDTFFSILYQRMFTVINAQYTFDDKYLECVSDHMAEMKPFGDVPHKLGIQLRRSFVATRTFYKSLMKGVEAATNMATLNVEDGCYREVTRMRFCGLCRGEAVAAPCPTYCSSVTQACLRHHTEFSNIWDSFVDAIDKVGDRLLGPYNIEVVVEPLNIKISEAIMNFQESGTEVSQKIYTKCGKPTMLSRPKRKAGYKDTSEDNPNMELAGDPTKMQGKKKRKKVPETTDNKTVLEKIIGDIKQKVKDTRQFWLHLPYQYCNNLSTNTNTTNVTQCWNGTDVGPFEATPQKTTLGESAILNEQVYVLQGLTDKLRKAFQGQEVEMVDDTEEPLAGSGSGSGDGDFEEADEDESGIVFHENREPDGAPFPTSSPSSTRVPEVVRASGAAASGMSLTGALVHYLLPMVLVWFGGAITNLL